MTARTAQNTPWIPIQNIQEHLQPEPALVLLGLALIAGLLYRIFLKRMSETRHQSLRRNFRNLAVHTTLAALLYLAFNGMMLAANSAADATDITPLEHGAGYVGLLALIWGAIVFVKVTRILVFEYLYLSHMTVEFPLLLVNMFTLLLSLAMATWFAAEIFSVRLTPLLATSAVFSLVLGLALQDTLGNLFSGIALQFDPPYTIGDWIEIQVGIPKWTGRVKEISWRATLLLGLDDELMTVPNKVIGQAMIANFTTKRHPISRSVKFKFPYEAPEAEVRKALLAASRGIAAIRTSPAPLVYASETSESGVLYKLVFYLDDYAAQWRVSDQVLSRCLEELAKAGLQPSANRLEIVQESPPSSRAS